MNRFQPSWFLLLGWALLASCSDRAGPAALSAAPIDLDLYPSAPEPRGRELTLTGVVDWPTDLATVEAVGAQLTFLADAASKGAPTLHVSTEPGATKFPEQVRIKLQGHFDPTTFNKLVIHALSFRECFVTCVFRSKGVPLLGSTNRGRLEPRELGSAPVKVMLDLPGARRLASVPDELELIFDSVQSRFRLGAIELYQQPIWAWLPAAEQGFDMVSLQGDARQGVGLSTERTLEAEVLVPLKAELRFSAAIPRALRSGGGDPFLQFEVHGSRGRPLIQRMPLEADQTLDASWHKARISLENFAGEKVRVIFAFHYGGRRREAVCALERPRIEVVNPSPRTVLLVTSDTHRADCVGAMNSAVPAHTPAIDALARRGVLFEDCWSSTNVTLPSHAALMTGTSPRDTGVLDNYTRLASTAPTLAEAFRGAGFTTYAVVSAPHLSDEASGLGQGFDRLSAPSRTNKRRSAESIEQLIGWLEDADGRDLFLWLHVFDAHVPYEPPSEFERRYWPADRDAFDPALPEPMVPPEFRVNMPAGLRDLELLSARYRGEVSYLDEQLARLFEVPRVRDGVIALTADHGESLGEHGIFWEHSGLYPQTIHVPLILAWPQAPGGTRVKRPVSQLDLAHTLLRLGGVKDPRIPGADLLEAQGRSAAPRFTISNAADRASVTKDGWHLIVSLRGYLVTVGAELVPFPRHHVELFDLARDPRCEHDLAQEELARARELRLTLCRWLSAATSLGWDDRGGSSPEMADQLAQLGYAALSSASSIHQIDPYCSCGECAPFLPRR